MESVQGFLLPRCLTRNCGIIDYFIDSAAWFLSVVFLEILAIFHCWWRWWTRLWFRIGPLLLALHQFRWCFCCCRCRRSFRWCSCRESRVWRRRLIGSNIFYPDWSCSCIGWAWNFHSFCSLDRETACLIRSILIVWSEAVRRRRRWVQRSVRGGLGTFLFFFLFLFCTFWSIWVFLIFPERAAILRNLHRSSSGDWSRSPAGRFYYCLAWLRRCWSWGLSARRCWFNLVCFYICWEILPSSKILQFLLGVVWRWLRLVLWRCRGWCWVRWFCCPWLWWPFLFFWGVWGWVLILACCACRVVVCRTKLHHCCAESDIKTWVSIWRFLLGLFLLKSVRWILVVGIEVMLFGGTWCRVWVLGCRAWSFWQNF